jgi:uncharacterized DUF497 family protein
VEFEWDRTKAETNLAKHGISFDTVRFFAFATALVVEDDRKDYGEVRMVALGFIGARLHHLVYTERGDIIRVISLRKASRKEIRLYVESI